MGAEEGGLISYAGERAHCWGGGGFPGIFGPSSLLRPPSLTRDNNLGRTSKAMSAWSKAIRSYLIRLCESHRAAVVAGTVRCQAVFWRTKIYFVGYPSFCTVLFILPSIFSTNRVRSACAAAHVHVYFVCCQSVPSDAGNSMACWSRTSKRPQTTPRNSSSFCTMSSAWVTE